MRLDSSFESLVGLASGRSGSVADLAEENARRPTHRHSYAAPSHHEVDLATPTKPFGLGKWAFVTCIITWGLQVNRDVLS